MSPPNQRNHSVVPIITFKDSRKAIAFYEKAFGAEVMNIIAWPNSQGVMHAAIKMGHSIIMMNDENQGSDQCPRSAESLNASPISFYIYVPDVDTAFKKAVEAGGSETMPVMDMFWGDSAGQITDPFGYSWMLATHQKDLSNEEIMKGAEDFMEKMSHI